MIGLEIEIRYLQRFWEGSKNGRFLTRHLIQVRGNSNRNMERRRNHRLENGSGLFTLALGNALHACSRERKLPKPISPRGCHERGRLTHAAEGTAAVGDEEMVNGLPRRVLQAALLQTGSRKEKWIPPTNAKPNYKARSRQT